MSDSVNDRGFDPEDYRVSARLGGPRKQQAMNPQDHLQKIKAKCEQLLAIAEKRTPGKWVSQPQTFHSTRGVTGYCVTDTRGFMEGTTVCGKVEQFDAAFIASTAGPFEASLKSTIAAIDGLLSQVEWDFFMEQAVTSIISAWPEELL